MLKGAFQQGVQDALEKFGLALPPHSTKPLTSGHGLPAPAQLPATPLRAPSPVSPLAEQAAKHAANVGMGASTAESGNGAGAVRGEPADAGRRQRSVIDRTFQSNDDFFSTSSMPAPGEAISP